MNPIGTLWCLLIILVSGLNGQLHFPVHFPGEIEPKYFNLEPRQNPITVIRDFCYNVFNSDSVKCNQLVSYVVSRLKELHGVDAVWKSHDGDIITFDEPSHSKDTVEEWGKRSYHINVDSLNGEMYSAVIRIPQFRTNIQTDVDAFCSEHHISGMGCRALSFELTNFVTSLYYREGGATMENVVSGMVFEQDIEWAYFPLTLVDPLGQLKRHFFSTDIQFVVLRACKYCLIYRLDRSECKLFVDHADKQLAAYYGRTYVGFLWTFQYILDALETIAKSTAEPGVADFVEIGTSNFDTLTQLVGEQEGLVGYAVEPSAHYLNSLPNRPRVTKVNCAIVTEDSVTADSGAQGRQEQYVDFYHIPEEVIDRLGLFYYLKGCNAIGAYHPSHVQAGMQQHVVVDKVHALTITQFLVRHNIRRIKLLKIDAEGYDLFILRELYNHIVTGRLPVVHVDRIIFETNDPQQEAFLSELIAQYSSLGYRLIFGGENTVMEKINE